MNKLELLSPAKDKKCAISAIEYGADAVYIGAPSYGARKNASNSLEDIAQVAKYAHKFFARVYVTLNTILDDSEINQVQKMLDDLYKIGVDGVIVQDFGILKLKLPPFLISASTQCDIRDLDKVKFFEKLGFDRAILARELSLDEIKEICKNSKIEIETFIHGALCVSYSGQCYLSRSQGARSANRGECAQPCRKKYTLINDNGKIYVKDKHLLNLKDFCAKDCIDDLVKAGVVSFKIEGRLKDENYVKNVTAFYNLKLKNYKRISSGKVFYDFAPDLNKSFNRDYTSYFLRGKNDDIFNLDTPKNRGEFIGRVEFKNNKYFKVKTKIQINPQDGLSGFFAGELSGMLVNKVEKTQGGYFVYPNKMPELKTGQEIYRNLDFEFEKKLKNSKTKRKIALKITVFQDKIISVDEDGILASVEIKDAQSATNPDVVKKTYISQLQKSGESDFYVENIDFKDENSIPFLRVAQINAHRRELFDKAIKNRLEEYEKKRACRKNKVITPAKFPIKNNDYRLNVHNTKALEFYKDCGVDVKEKSYEAKKVQSAELMRTKHCIRRALNMCLKKGANQKEKLFLLNENSKKFKLEFDCKNCEMIIKEEN